jgi:hypothetical protein
MELLPSEACSLNGRKNCQLEHNSPEAESKEKHGVWDPIPELNINSPNIFTMGIPLLVSTLTLCQSRLHPPVRYSGFGLSRKNSFLGQYQQTALWEVAVCVLWL